MNMDQVKAELRTNESSEVVCEDNEEGTFTLCYNKVEEDPLNPRYLLNFAVVDKSTGKTVHKESVTGGYVKWLDSNSIEYFSAPGIVPEGKTKNDYTKIYKPKTGKTVTKEAFLLEKKQ